MTRDLNPSTAFLCMYCMYVSLFGTSTMRLRSGGAFFFSLAFYLFLQLIRPRTTRRLLSRPESARMQIFDVWIGFGVRDSYFKEPMVVSLFDPFCTLLFGKYISMKVFFKMFHCTVFWKSLTEVNNFCFWDQVNWFFCWKLAFPFSGNLWTYSGGCGMFVNSSLQSLRSGLRHLLHEKKTWLWKSLNSKVSLYQWDLRGYNAKWADWTFLSCCQESQNRTPLKLREKTRRKSCKTLRRLQGQYSACSSPAASSSATKFRIV